MSPDETRIAAANEALRAARILEIEKSLGELTEETGVPWVADVQSNDDLLDVILELGQRVTRLESVVTDLKAELARAGEAER